VLAVSGFGTRGVPLIDGGVRFLGGCCPCPLEPEAATPVARMAATTATVTVAVTRRLITSLDSGYTSRPVTLKWGSSEELLRILAETTTF
jgi:hypothetical protein